MVSRDYFILFIGGLAGSSATAAIYGDLTLALIFLLAASIKLYLIKKGELDVRRN